uniref:Uncharacterized protein, isoform A n=1 Tax=Drosophila melanogaster TaxID=7227 RepID=Q9VBC1_DROME|nr:uncharacterized protein Dmel_CG14246, isoform B [Drosophila melanogaster]NP_001287547.1 uncharacterized protein Dmel_CG14246, isoform C [Drosophila melanogaster]NP_652260.1 uncharacterized protein Dmel_CG14246, isoform A [Drosophila melanogaster]AAF56621.1 uncharacterized protein Dmel_CG14246, isoform A [Drosophila melanogaster]AHN57545.1 uncharacterized protein Dmel_CG14246, isoform B [Drosophila melanogaster]AHN57546.1 uncharacterized protein Dmel_CG14246, isoform C [Drosophila melanogast|eukprot:NP_001287546.1 uncharacterized protein Dmel_CG14246, isoform B [Drosophila melanogaster]
MSGRDYNGEPGCRSAEELGQSYRHFWDPTAYWQCGGKSMEEERERDRDWERERPAQLQRCPANELFYDRERRCVKWKHWQWTEPQDPPTKPRK